MGLGHEPELGSYGGRTTCASRRGAPDALPVVQVGKYVRFRPADLLEYVDRRSRTAVGDLVFPKRKGEPLRESKLLTRVLQPPAERAGLGRVTWHQFRHVHSSLLADLGVPVKIAQSSSATPASRRRSTSRRTWWMGSIGRRSR
jgi:integrase